MKNCFDTTSLGGKLKMQVTHWETADVLHESGMSGIGNRAKGNVRADSFVHGRDVDRGHG
jgi:hypothetical protein